MTRTSEITNYNDLKLLSREELEEIVPSGFEFKTKPWKHQLACFLATIANDGFLDCMDLGTGKSKVAIDVCRYYATNRPSLKVLVVCLNNAVGKWADEVAKHSDMTARCLKGTAEERWNGLFGANFFIINYESIIAMMNRRGPSEKIIQGDGSIEEVKGKMALDRKLMHKFAKAYWDVLIVDESHKIKNHLSKSYNLIKYLSRFIKWRMLLTGTLFGGNLLDVWAQYCVIDFGRTFTPSITKFRKAYFVNKGYFGPKWVVTESGEKAIQAKLFRKAIRYSEEEVEELPQKVYRVEEFELAKAQRTAYDSLVHDLEHKPFAVRSIDKHARTMAFRQICGGFIKKTDFIFDQNPKLMLLREIIETIAETRKFVIFHEFIQEGLFIEALLKDLKIKHSILNGRIKDKYQQYSSFEKDPSIRGMVAHPLSGGSSIDLVGAMYCIFFSNGRRVIDRRQCEKRIHRPGQKSNRVFYYDLVAKNTLELPILYELARGKDAFDRIMDKKSLVSMLRGSLAA